MHIRVLHVRASRAQGASRGRYKADLNLIFKGQTAPLGAAEGRGPTARAPGTAASSSSPPSSGARSSPRAMASAVGVLGGSSVAISRTGGPRDPAQVVLSAGRSI